MLQLPSNPNATSNRVPEGAELVSLRAIAVHKKRVMDQLSQEARVARAAYGEVKHRYEVQSPALQSTQSELHVAKELAECLEKIAASLERELGQLRGLLHPVRRCPDDILALIFEATQGSFYYAVTLSHVCQRWRAIAISLPHLWGRIRIGFNLPDDRAESQVQAFLSRVKEVPAVITLNLRAHKKSDITKVRTLGKVLQASHVVHLYIYIQGFESPSILEALPTFPPHRLASLTMVDGSGLQSPGPWNGFLSRFRSINNLCLRGGSFGPGTSQHLQSTFGGIVKVTLDFVDGLPLASLLRTMPDVQHLDVRDCFYAPDLEDSSKRIALPNLRSLCTGGVMVPWEKIDCPLITKVYLIDNIALETASFWAFLPSARMLTGIRLNPSSSQLSSLARVAPQILDLYLEGIRHDKAVLSVLVDWRRFGLDGPAFPKLKLLHLSPQQPGNTINLESLNSLIQGRCLSRAHSESAMEATTILDKFVIIAKNRRPPWNRNQHIANYFNESGKAEANGDVAYHFVGGSAHELQT